MDGPARVFSKEPTTLSGKELNPHAVGTLIAFMSTSPLVEGVVGALVRMISGALSSANSLQSRFSPCNS